MSEPRLENISDYRELKGQKRRVVVAVICAGLIMGTIFAVAKSYYSTANDEIAVEERIGKVPAK